VYSDSVLSGYVQTGQLSTGVAEELLILRDLETRRDFAERAVRESWSQDQARGRVRALRLDLELADVGRLARELHDRLTGSVRGPSAWTPSPSCGRFRTHRRTVARGTGQACDRRTALDRGG
jgi:hypothetical protein